MASPWKEAVTKLEAPSSLSLHSRFHACVVPSLSLLDVLLCLALLAAGARVALVKELVVAVLEMLVGLAMLELRLALVEDSTSHLCMRFSEKKRFNAS